MHRVNLLLAILACALTAVISAALPVAAGARPVSATAVSARSAHRAVARHRHHKHARRRHHLVPAGASTNRAASVAPAAPPVPTSCANTNLTPTPANLGDVEAATLCLINQQRGQAGLKTLAPNPLLAQAAQSHNQDMLQANYFGHVSPSGSTPVARLTNVGYILSGFGYSVGENLAWGTGNLATPAAMVQAWMASPEHRANILGSDYTETGLAVAAAVPASVSGGQPGALYTEEFGTIIG